MELPKIIQSHILSFFAFENDVYDLCSRAHLGNLSDVYTLAISAVSRRCHLQAQDNRMSVVQYHVSSSLQKHMGGKPVNHLVSVFEAPFAIPNLYQLVHIQFPVFRNESIEEFVEVIPTMRHIEQITFTGGLVALLESNNQLSRVKQIKNARNDCIEVNLILFLSQGFDALYGYAKEMLQTELLDKFTVSEMLIGDGVDLEDMALLLATPTVRGIRAIIRFKHYSNQVDQFTLALANNRTLVSLRLIKMAESKDREPLDIELSRKAQDVFVKAMTAFVSDNKKLQRLGIEDITCLVPDEAFHKAIQSSLSLARLKIRDKFKQFTDQQFISLTQAICLNKSLSQVHLARLVSSQVELIPNTRTIKLFKVTTYENRNRVITII
ncbi:hypothetical protein DFA_00199 [Cavenderia fasciculata]|uniref:Uncharacterized protein n=1 Tax=Cavenderia fasciculata TaxID=261658 RepID=F4PXW1_CACFS|nr:uncharacterized protein DFA_00199 [Cavenderia fasciculata]EGG19621.1 hypothetical protein DFA_00199 [Cavenderia fasciculata]|eukprot:XP_004357915.1 hypothetical protein DFA_00199 [Cavenderia fasciculata]